MDTSFEYSVRVLLCDHCGAPLSVKPDEQSVVCRYCQAQHLLVPRTEQLTIRHPDLGIPEAERLRRLRMQDGKLPPMPANVMHMLFGGRVILEKLDLVSNAWRDSRRAVAARAGPDSEHRLCVLTQLLANYYIRTNDRLRQRAMYESALEVFHALCYCQWMLGLLSENACRLGDLIGAEQWLAHCHPASDDLMADTAYRLAFSRIATARGQYQRVLDALGPHPGAVPIADMADNFTTVLRANALERLGYHQPARQQLLQMMRQGPAGWHAIMATVRSGADLNLCPQTLPQVDAELQRRSPPKRSEKATQLRRLAIAFPIALVADVALRVAGQVLDVDDLHPYVLGVEFTIGVLVVIAPFLIVSWYRDRWIRRNGQVVPATVDGTHDYKGSDEPRRAEVTLLVHAPGVAAPARAVIHLRADDDVYRRCYPGAEVEVRMHPTDPTRVRFEHSS